MAGAHSLKRKRTDESARSASPRKRRSPSPDLYDKVLLNENPLGELAAGEEDDDNDIPVVTVKPVSQEELERYNAKVDRSGIIYLSRIPPGMGPAQVRHQLARYGELGRVFLQRDERDRAKGGKKKRVKHQSHRFVEGWVEFADKKVARSIADMLNARPIGGPKSSPFHDDIWTMKYLPRFKWAMLSEQVALEASTQAALLRSHLAQSKRDQAAYLQQVERARVDTKRAEKRAAREERAQERGETLAAKAPSKRKERVYEQRAPVDSRSKQATAGQSSKELEEVLQNLF